jgi:acyl-CoA synthetase (AMP-forming)/AMP-acid ligase II
VLFADSDYPGAAGVGHVPTMPDDYEDLIATADDVPLGDGVTEDNLAALFYTSGTSVELPTEPLPKSAAGKILKRDLREPHWAGRQTQVSGG